MRNLNALSLLTILLSACNSPAEQATDVSGTNAADIVFVEGTIYTVDPERTVAEAVAVKNGSIVFVGGNEVARGFVGPNTKVIDLGGRLMLPGFQDSHIHPMSGGIEAMSCDLNGLAGLPEYRGRIAEYAAANPNLPWITGGGWSMAEFGPGGIANKSILDELVPDRPVYLTSFDGHTGWANSKALEIAGINNDTPDPAGGRIDRDPDTGEAIGSLQEYAMSLVRAHVPADTVDTRAAGLLYATKMLHEYGITSIQDASVGLDGLQAYAALEKRGKLNLRVVASQWWDKEGDMSQVDELIQRREQFTTERLRATTVKIMQDGVLENFTGAMLEPYLVDGHGKGMSMVDPDELMKILPRLDAEGFQVHFHAIGDGAIRQALDAIEEARLENRNSSIRHHISHLQIIHPDDIARFGELDVSANFSPFWASLDDYINELNIPAIGEERVSWMYSIRSVEEAGGRIVFGSDWSVSTANPFYQIETAVTRKDPLDDSDDAFIPEEGISLDTAVAAFTINSAFVNKHEEKTGSIVEGKYADLIVLDQNLFDIDADAISDTRVLLTLFNGEIVHGEPNAL